MFRPVVTSLSLAVLLSSAACSSFTRREIYDTRTPAQQIADGEQAAKTVNDLTDLYRRDLDQGISLLDRIPRKSDEHPNWGAQWTILTAASDHALEERERVASGTGISAQEVNAVVQHKDAQAALNRAWVLQGSKTANPEAVLSQLEAPKPWPARTSLSTRINGGDARSALEIARLHLYNYAGLMDQMVGVAKKKGLSGAGYWDTESRAIAGVYAIVEADVVAMRAGTSLADRRISSSWDMASASRILMGYRLSEATAPVLHARAVLSREQARSLQGENFKDTEALARFRGYWLDARSKVNRGWVSALIAQSPALRTTLFRDIPDDKIAERGPGLIDSEIDQDPGALLTVWWCFRAIPPNMFYGDGSYSLPSSQAVATDSNVLDEMLKGAEPQVFVPKPAPGPEDKSVPSGPAKPSKTAAK